MDTLPMNLIEMEPANPPANSGCDGVMVESGDVNNAGTIEGKEPEPRHDLEPLEPGRSSDHDAERPKVLANLEAISPTEQRKLLPKRRHRTKSRVDEGLEEKPEKKKPGRKKAEAKAKPERKRKQSEQEATKGASRKSKDGLGEGSTASAALKSPKVKKERKKKAEKASSSSRPSNAKSEPSEPSKKEVPAKESADPDAAKEAAKAENKKRQSRKSSAYHCALRNALKDGKDMAEAKTIAKEVPWLFRFVSD